MTKQTLAIDTAALAAVALFVSTEETRYYLCGVQITSLARESHYVATDGCCLLAARIPVQDGDPDNEWQGEIIVPTHAIPKHNRREPYLLLERDGDRWQLGDKVFTPVDGTFPDWRRVVPRECSGETAQFDFAFGKRFAAAAKLLGCGRPEIRHNGLAPAGVTFTPDVFGVIVPFRSNNDAFPPLVPRNPASRIRSRGMTAKRSPKAEIVLQRPATLQLMSQAKNVEN